MKNIMQIIGKIYLWGSAGIVMLVIIAYFALVIILPPPSIPIVYTISDLKNPNQSNFQNKDCEVILNNLAAIIIDISQKTPELIKDRVDVGKYVQNVLPETIPVECTKDLTKYFKENIHSPAANGIALHFNINIRRFGFVVRNNGKIEAIFVIPGRDSL